MEDERETRAKIDSTRDPKSPIGNDESRRWRGSDDPGRNGEEEEEDNEDDGEEVRENREDNKKMMKMIMFFVNMYRIYLFAC